MNPTAAADGAEHLLRILEEVGRRWEPESIDEVWIFPTRRIGSARSAVAVIALFEEAGERRRIVTARATDRKGPRNKTVVALDFAEHGSAPADRVARLIDGVLRRLDEDLADAPPRAVRIEGQSERWLELVAEHQSTASDPTALPATAPRA